MDSSSNTNITNFTDTNNGENLQKSRMEGITKHFLIHGFESFNESFNKSTNERTPIRSNRGEQSRRGEEGEN